MIMSSAPRSPSSCVCNASKLDHVPRDEGFGRQQTVMSENSGRMDTSVDMSIPNAKKSDDFERRPINTSIRICERSTPHLNTRRHGVALPHDGSSIVALRQVRHAVSLHQIDTQIDRDQLLDRLTKTREKLCSM